KNLLIHDRVICMQNNFDMQYRLLMGNNRSGSPNYNNGYPQKGLLTPISPLYPFLIMEKKCSIEFQKLVKVSVLQIRGTLFYNQGNLNNLLRSLQSLIMNSLLYRQILLL